MMENSTSKTISRWSLFGPPPILEGEDAAAYDELFGRRLAAELYYNPSRGYKKGVAAKGAYLVATSASSARFGFSQCGREGVDDVHEFKRRPCLAGSLCLN